MHPKHPNNRKRGRKGKAPPPPLSAYEQKRQQSIASNNEKLKQLGLISDPKPKVERKQRQRVAQPPRDQQPRASKAQGAAKRKRDAHDDTMGSDREEDHL